MNHTQYELFLSTIFAQGNSLSGLQVLLEMEIISQKRFWVWAKLRSD